MRWAYGVMSVSRRLNTLLPKTLNSLVAAGFDRPYVFMDRSETILTSERYAASGVMGFPLTVERKSEIGPFGNWLLGMWELYLRNPNAERYAMFQDDVVCCRNLRQYIDRCYYPEGHGYWNLFTFTATVDVAKSSQSNEELAEYFRKRDGSVSWYHSNQLGRGAVALVFDRAGLQSLLTSRVVVEHPMDCTRGTRRIDGVVCDALKEAGYKEYVHWPSLVQHVGDVSTIGNPQQRPASSFPGEEFDALSLLKGV